MSECRCRPGHVCVGGDACIDLKQPDVARAILDGEDIIRVRQKAIRLDAVLTKLGKEPVFLRTLQKSLCPGKVSKAAATARQIEKAVLDPIIKEMEGPGLLSRLSEERRTLGLC